MRKTIVLGTTLILLQIPLLAHLLLQERTWGGPDRDGAQGVAVAGDGSVYVTGETRSFGTGDGDAFLLKYNASGTLEWQRTYGTAPDGLNSGEEAGIGVAVAPDNSGVLVLGNYRDGNIFLAKFSPVGDLQWDLTWGSNQEGARAIAVATDGTIYVTGVTNGFGVEQGDAFLLSFSSDGTLLNWQRTWGGPSFDVPSGVAVATDGGIYISGDTTFSANSAFLVKFAADGSVIWQREWAVIGRSPFPEDDQTLGGGVAAAPAGGAYVAGWTFGAGFNPNLIAAQFDAAGNAVWHRVGGPGFGAAVGVAVGADGKVHLTGSILSADELTGGNAFVWTLLGEGKPDSASIWGGNDQFEGEGGQGIAVTASGDIVVVGAAGAPPYTLSRGSKTAKSVAAFVAETAGKVTQPAGVVGDPAAVVNTPAGSEAFAGVQDAFLLRVQP